MTVEAQLREIDLQGETLGWSNEHTLNTIFVVWKTADDKYTWATPEPINDALKDWCCIFLHSPALTITHLSECTEKLRALWKASGLPDPKDILGIGIRSECVRMREATSLMEMLQRQVVGLNVGDGTEMRFTSYFGRDGSMCQLDHDRGQMPTFLEDKVDIGQGVEEAMIKLLNALVPETVEFNLEK